MQANQLLYLILTLAGFLLYLFFVYHIAAVFLAGPRLLAKTLSTEKNNPSEVARKKKVILVLLFSCLTITIIFTYLFANQSFQELSKIALIVAGSVVGLKVLFSALVYVPLVGLLVSSMEPIIEPPFLLRRELGKIYTSFTWVIILSFIVFMMVAGHFVSIVFLIFGTYMTLRYSKLLKKDEEYQNIEYYFDKLENGNPNARELSIGILSDFRNLGDDRISEKLVEHLSHHHKHGKSDDAFGYSQSTLMPYFHEYSRAIRALRKIKDVKSIKGLKEFKEQTGSFLTELVSSTLQELNEASGINAAARSNDTKSIQDLIDKGVDINFRDRDGMTPLMHSAIKGHIDTVKMLLDQNAHIGISDNHGKSVLDLAHANNQQKVVDLIKNTLNIDSTEEATSERIGCEPLENEVIILDVPAIETSYASPEGCHVFVTNKRLVFYNPNNNEGSFDIDTNRLKDSKIEPIKWQDCRTLKIKLTDGQKYFVFFDKREDSLFDKLFIVLKYQISNLRK